MAEGIIPAVKAPHPVSLEVEAPERLSRLTTFFRILLAIPQLIVVSLLGYALGIVSVIAWFAILFTGRFPRGLFDFNLGVMRWQANVSAYTSLLRDEYPPFTTEPGNYPVTFDIPYPERQSRFRLFIRFIAIIPNQFVFIFVSFASAITTVIAWVAILIGGKYPQRFFAFNVGVMRWSQRQNSYLYLMRDEYPPYGLKAGAPPGNELLSGIIAVPLVVALVALVFVPGYRLLGRETETVRVLAPLSRLAPAGAAPSGEANGVRVTLLGYDDSVPAARGHLPNAGHRYVSFDFLAEKKGSFPTVFAAFFFQLYDCQNDTYSPAEASRGSEFEVFWTGGDNRGTVFFEIPRTREPCLLVYHSGLGRIRFLFLGGP